MTIPLKRLGAALLLVLAATACQQGGTTAPPAGSGFANWPEALQDFRFRWSAEPGIDLLTGPAIPLRAYLESHRIGDYTRNVDDAYPGFSRAVPPVGKPRDDSSSDLPAELWNLQPATDTAMGDAPPYFGNEYLHVLSLTPIEVGYRADVCDGLYQVFHQGDAPGTYTPFFKPLYSPTEPDVFGIRVWRVEFTDHPTPPSPNDPPAVTVPQHGPNPAPLGDVFGPWHITGASTNTAWGPNSETDPNYPQLRQRCADLMPHDAAQRMAYYTSVLKAPPPVEPAVPGWPASTA